MQCTSQLLKQKIDRLKEAKRVNKNAFNSILIFEIQWDFKSKAPPEFNMSPQLITINLGGAAETVNLITPPLDTIKLIHTWWNYTPVKSHRQCHSVGGK